MSDDLIPIILRAGTAAAAAASNRVLLLNEPGFETDTRGLKVGDGTTPYNDLLYTSVPPDEAPWTSYVPTIDVASGALGSATATGRYQATGKTVHLNVRIDIASTGTAGGYIRLSLPFPAAATDPSDQTILIGRETATVGSGILGVIPSGQGVLILLTFANGYPGADGYSLQASGTYQRS